MNVSEVMTESVACCRPEDRDNRAAQLMWENDCGVLPVVDATGRGIGVVTDRDLCMAAYTSGRALSGLSVAEAMSHELFGCKQQDSLEDALAEMRQHRVRRLPVLDADQHVVGILSMNDVLRAVGQGGRKGRKSLADAMLETLGAIGEHREAPATELVPRAKAQTKAKAGKAAKSRSPGARA